MALRRIIPGAALIGLMVCLTLAAPPAAAQNTGLGPLLDRLDRLERDLITLQQQLYRGVPPASPGGTTGTTGSAPAVAQMEVRLTDFETELSNVTGKIEEMSFNLEQLQGRLDKLVADIDFRLRALEQAQVAAVAPGTGSGSQAQVPPAAPDPGSVTAVPPGAMIKTEEGTIYNVPVEAIGSTLPEGTTNEQYAFAYALLREAQMSSDEPEAEAVVARAERAFDEFIRTHPNDEKTPNAYYWLGETFYFRGDYAQAAVRFAAGYEKFPNSPKASASLLKLGMSLANLGNKQEACTALAQLQKKFAHAPANILDRATRERQRAGCR